MADRTSYDNFRRAAAAKDDRFLINHKSVGVITAVILGALCVIPGLFALLTAPNNTLGALIAVMLMGFGVWCCVLLVIRHVAYRDEIYHRGL